MTTQGERWLRFLTEQTRGLGREETLVRLFELGVVDGKRCGQAFLRAEVERLVRQGRGRCEAMEETAERCGCSYGKVREAVYYKPKKI